MSSDETWLRDARQAYVNQLENDVLPLMERTARDVLDNRPTANDIAHVDQLMAWARDQRAAIPRWRLQFNLNPFDDHGDRNA